MNPRRCARLALLATLAGLFAVVLAACSSAADVAHVSSSTAATTTTSTLSSTSPTTTTLPIALPGTSILRVRVAALPPGAIVPPALSPASAAWLKTVQIAYSRFGSGPDLVLIEGQDASLSWWDPTLLSALSGHYRVTIFDLPGAGYSGAATAPLSLGYLADMTAGFASAVGLSHPVVLGWGLGGEVALSLAERHPGFASSLVLVDTSGGGTGAHRPYSGAVRLLATPGATPVALSRLLFPPTGAGMKERVVWQKSLYAGTTDWLTATTINAEARLQAAVWRRSPLTEGLSHLKTRALVVSGTDDVLFAPQDASLLADELPHATLVRFAHAGYGAITQDEQAFVSALEKFTG